MNAVAQREVEAKFDVEAGWVMPSLEPLVPGGRVQQRTVQLVSTYVDTADRHLLRSRLTLRRRTGDIDTGWQLKVPDGDARIELRWPLGGRGVPAAVREITSGVRGRAALSAVAVISVERRVHTLVDREGVALAEVVHDRVLASRTAGGGSDWHEVEVELLDGSPELLRRAGKLLLRSSARRSASVSKLARALDSEPVVSHREGSMAAVVAGYLDRQWESILRGDLDLRRGGLPVHDTRTAIRRYRSVLRLLAPALDADRAASLDGALRVFAAELGEVRDVEVVAEFLQGLVDELPTEVAVDAVRSELDAELGRAHAESTATLHAYLGTRAHAQLMAALREWHETLPMDEARPAAELMRFVRRADRRSRRRRDAVPRRHAADDQRMHSARKAAKRARYLAELAQDEEVGHRKALVAVGRRNKRVQQELGHRQDAVTAARFLATRFAERQSPATFGIGVLYRLCRERAYG